MTDARDAGTSLTLLQRLLLSEADAWERFAYLYGPLVRSWAAHRGVAETDADDVVQDVFHVVVTKLVGFHRDRPGDSFRGWLHGVTRNVLLRHAERAGQQPQAPGGTVALQNLNAVADVVAVADEMGVSAAAVRQAKSRVLRRLKEELGERIE